MFIKKYKKRIKGFTLTELMITVAIVVVLSMIAYPIYQDYIGKSKTAEGYTLLSQIRDSQLAYYNEYEYFYTGNKSYFGINTNVNQYFKIFSYKCANNKADFTAIATYVVTEYINKYVTLVYNLTNGATYI